MKCQLKLPLFHMFMFQKITRQMEKDKHPHGVEHKQELAIKKRCQTSNYQEPLWAYMEASMIFFLIF